MDADTRARLADALATATPAQLREDAAFIANAQTLLGNNDERFLRLAALALAVATMQARDAWKRAATCRTVFRLPCPTRTQAFVAGSIVTLGVLVAVRR